MEAEISTETTISIKMYMASYLKCIWRHISNVYGVISQMCMASYLKWLESFYPLLWNAINVTIFFNIRNNLVMLQFPNQITIFLCCSSRNKLPSCYAAVPKPNNHLVMLQFPNQIYESMLLHHNRTARVVYNASIVQRASETNITYRDMMTAFCTKSDFTHFALLLVVLKMTYST
jgi:hypothetical protein